MENIKEEWLTLLQETSGQRNLIAVMIQEHQSGLDYASIRHVLILGFPFLKNMISYEKIVDFFQGSDSLSRIQKIEILFACLRPGFVM